MSVKSDHDVFFVQLFNMLKSNSAEICEPYTYEFVNSLTDMKDSITRADGINISNTLSLHLKNYVKV